MRSKREFSIIYITLGAKGIGIFRNLKKYHVNIKDSTKVRTTVIPDLAPPDIEKALFTARFIVRIDNTSDKNSMNILISGTKHRILSTPGELEKPAVLINAFKLEFATRALRSVSVIKQTSATHTNQDIRLKSVLKIID